MAVMMEEQSVESYLESINRKYEAYHKAYENNFWATKMNLNGNSAEALTKTKTEMDRFLGDPVILAEVERILSSKSPEALGPKNMKILKIMQKTLRTYIITDPEALAIREELGVLEAELQQVRNNMHLGYLHPETGEQIKASSVQLRNTMRTSSDPKVRFACWTGLRSIGVAVVEKFVKIVKLRNKLGKSCGFEDYYDMKCTQSEGFSKKKLFEILDDLEAKTKGIMDNALKVLAKEKGEEALKPESMGYYLSGESAKQKDPYFPFENAVDVWARSFAALGITYRGATMRLDLCDRPGKYSNGFCHWPTPAWESAQGWVPSETNFTSLATPSAIGSGHTAITTLMHEAGHAAHFANVCQPSPLFSQERAPTSVAYAENQSMFLDSLVDDAAWMARYCISRTGEPIPWATIKDSLEATHDFKVFQLRAMLAVPYFEKRLYELPDEEVTPARLLSLADEVERDVQGTLAGRPLLSVPHILSDESSAYYHGYVLAEMSVHQTRLHFEEAYGQIVDNPQIGKDLAEVYWKPGNSEQFMDLVLKLTGKPLSCAAWVDSLSIPLKDLLESEKAAYDAALVVGAKLKPGATVDLDMKVLLVDGDELIANSDEEGLWKACEAYKGWLETRA